MPDDGGLGMPTLFTGFFGQHVNQWLARASQRHPDPVEQALPDPQAHVLREIGVAQGSAARGQFP